MKSAVKIQRGTLDVEDMLSRRYPNDILSLPLHG